MPIFAFRHLVTTSALALATLLSSVARADDPAANPPAPLTDAEKAKVRDLIFCMWVMQREDEPNETLNSCLNPPGQGGTQTMYEDTDRGVFGRGPTTVADALRHYVQMMRSGKLMKDPCKWGASTTMKPGLADDVVTISGKFLAIWCDPTASSVDRAKAKFQQMASLANEAAHVYQKESPTLTTAQWRPIRCDGERDSDIMSIKALQRAIARVTDALGNAHSSLADIEAEGRGGMCLAKCLRDLGVDTPAEIAAVVADLKAKLAHYQDRKANLFEVQINNGTSWRDLYYGGKYQSPLRLKVDVSMLQSMRKIKLMFGNGAVNEFVVPEDGKVPVGYIVTVNKMGQIVVIVVTWGPNGALCFHVWTDTDFDGMPDAGPVTTAIPGTPFFGDVVPGAHDAWLLHAPTSQLGFNDTLLLHDRRNGSLTAFDMNNAGIPTGVYRTMLRSPLIASPDSGNPDAGGFITLFDVDETSSPGLMRAIFLARGELDAAPDGAVVGLYQSVSGTGTFQLPSIVALALAPRNPIGPAYLPPRDDGLILVGNPGEPLRLDSVGQGVTQTLGVGVVEPTGQTTVPTPPFPPAPDLYTLLSLFTGDTIPFATVRAGVVADILDRPFIGGPNSDVLVLSSFPGRLSLFNGDPAPAFQFQAEIVTEDPDPGLLSAPTPSSPVSIANFAGQVVLHPIAGSPLLAQTLIDLDGDGLADDAAVLARLPGPPQTLVFTVLNALSNSPMWFPSVTLNFEPAGITYLNIDADNRRDLSVADALGGPGICLISQGAAGFLPGPCTPPCPADFNHNGALSVQDIFDFLAAYFTIDPRADFNGSGAITVQDIFDFLAAYFTGC